MKQHLILTVCVMLTCLGYTSVANAQTQPQQHDNIVIILDASGSMSNAMPGTSQSKMQVAKTALKKVLDQTPATTQVGLLVFSGRNKKSDWLQPLGSVNRDQLNEALEKLRPEGSTPLGRYLKIGADQLLEQRGKQLNFGTSTLLIVTDGQATDMNMVDGYTPDILGRGIRMDVIGVAMDDEHSLARKVHRYRRADNPEALDQAIAQTMAEVGTRATDGNTDNENFAIIAPLPDGVPQELIRSLCTFNDKPIQIVRQARQNQSQVTTPRPTPPATSTHPATPHQNPPVHTTHTSNRFSWVFALIIAIIVLKSLKAMWRKSQS